MVVETLSAELERLYELEELKSLSSGLLGLDPNEVGGATAKASFARALAQRCLEIDAIDALVDAAQASRRPLPVELLKKLRNGALDSDERPHEGDELGELLVLRELGESASSTVYRVKRGSEDLRVKRLSREVRARRSDVQRYFAASRIVGGVVHPGLPVGVNAGSVDPSGRLWDLEHGPRGGDELNLVKPGRNYGWPVVSNGDNYDGTPIPRHATRPEFAAPAISWNPVISPAGFIIYNGDLFPQWKGNGFIGGMSSQSLVRIEFNGETAREAERLDMHRRIREVEQGPDGAIWLLEDGRGRLLKLTPG